MNSQPVSLHKHSEEVLSPTLPIPILVLGSEMPYWDSYILPHGAEGKEEIGVVITGVPPMGIEQGLLLHLGVFGVEQLEVAIAQTVIRDGTQGGVPEGLQTGCMEPRGPIEIAHLEHLRRLEHLAPAPWRGTIDIE